MEQFKNILREVLGKGFLKVIIEEGKYISLHHESSGIETLKTTEPPDVEWLNNLLGQLLPQEIANLKMGRPILGALNIPKTGKIMLIAKSFPKLSLVLFLPPNGEKISREYWKELNQARAEETISGKKIEQKEGQGDSTKIPFFPARNKNQENSQDDSALEPLETKKKSGLSWLPADENKIPPLPKINFLRKNSETENTASTNEKKLGPTSENESENSYIPKPGLRFNKASQLEETEEEVQAANFKHTSISFTTDNDSKDTNEEDINKWNYKATTKEEDNSEQENFQSFKLPPPPSERFENTSESEETSQDFDFRFQNSTTEEPPPQVTPYKAQVKEQNLYSNESNLKKKIDEPPNWNPYENPTRSEEVYSTKDIKSEKTSSEDIRINFSSDLENFTAKSRGDHEIDGLLQDTIKSRASDLHLTTSQPIIMRIDGEIVRRNDETLTSQKMESLLLPIIPLGKRGEFAKTWDIDFAYEVEKLGRFRFNIFRDNYGVCAVARHIPDKIKSAEDLNLPQSIIAMCQLSKGLVLVTGPTGSGKSTTLAAMIDYVNKTRKEHIITIEDPIEFVHPQHNCLINQREIGKHTASFSRALKAALREDPDIVLVGELRDLETTAIAIETAETGHLVFATLHTNSAVSTINRVIDQYPSEQQRIIRNMLCSSLKGVVSQTLVKKKGGGRVAAYEILTPNDAVGAMIRESKNHMIENHMQTQTSSGNCLLNDALTNLVANDVVEYDDAWSKAIDKKEFENIAKRKKVAQTR